MSVKLPKGFRILDMKGAIVLYSEKYISEYKTWYQMVDESVDWKTFPVKVMGKVHSQPRQSFYMADYKHTYKYSGFDRRPDEWCTTMLEMRKILNSLVQEIMPNHPDLNAVLGNKYNDGDQYIGRHSDDEKDLNKDAFIVSVSLGAKRDFIFTHKKTKEKMTISLEPGSVLLMGGDCQKNWMHEVPKRKKIKDPRINLTFRSINKK
jgi:alkylated DNA repair dioxygenase AlkB